MTVKGEDLSSLGGRIRAARLRAKMSQAALAAAVRERVQEVVGQDYVSRWETGVTRTSDEVVREIGAVLKVSAGWLTHGPVPGVEVPEWARRRAASTFGNEATDEADERIKRQSRRKGAKKRGA